MPLMVEAHLYRGGEADEAVGGEGDLLTIFFVFILRITILHKIIFYKYKID